MTTAYTALNPVPMSALPTTSGVVQQFLVSTTNPGIATFAPDGLASAPIFGLAGQQLQGGEVVSGGIVTLVSYLGPLLNSGSVCWVLLSCEGGTQQVGSGTGSQQAATVGQVQSNALNSAVAGGSANALTATIASTLSALTDGQTLTLSASTANTGATTAVVTLGSTALTSLPVVKGNNQALAAGDIPSAGYPIVLTYSASYTALVMQNPANGITTNGNEALQIGDLKWSANSTPSTGWMAVPLVATNVSRTTYAALFAAIGTTYGAGDGSTTFGLPWTVNGGTTLNSSAIIGTHSSGAVIDHAHLLDVITVGFLIGDVGETGVTVPSDSGSSTQDTGGANNLAAGTAFSLQIRYA